MAEGLVVGIDLGGTNMQAGVVDANGAVLGRAYAETRPEEGEAAVMDRLAQLARDACARAATGIDGIEAVGIGAPGAIDHGRGVVLEAPNLRWNDVPLAEQLGPRLDGVRVRLDNDVNVATLGECRHGAGAGADEALGIWVGTGIGGGIVLGGQVHHGGFGTAGEIGHVLLFPTAPLGQRRLEEIASRAAIERRLTQLVRANHESAIGGAVEQGTLDIRTVQDAYQSGDALVTHVVDEAADLLGRVVANAVTLLGIRLVILGGGLTESLGEPYLKRVRAAAHEHVFPARCAEVEIVETALRREAGIIGAALLART